MAHEQVAEDNEAGVSAVEGEGFERALVEVATALPPTPIITHNSTYMSPQTTSMI